jgi:hypothetical protein
LITVPSCDAHNSEKSGEDEYFRGVFLSSALLDGNSEVVTQRCSHQRALERALSRGFKRIGSREDAEAIEEVVARHGQGLLGPGNAVRELEERRLLRTGLYGLMHRDVEEAQVMDGSGKLVPTTSFSFSLERLNNFLSCIARALLFHETGAVWTGVVAHLPHAFLPEDAPVHDVNLRNYFVNALAEERVKGVSPGIFHYALLPGLEDNGKKDFDCTIGYCFFNSFHFTTLFSSKTRFEPQARS